MKKLFTLLATVTLSVMLFAQAPQSFSYQTVIRDASWQVLSNQNISLEISIIEDVANGTAIYTESHSATTNELGLVNLSIGDGGVMSGSWSNIDWGNHTYFIEVAVDVTGGTSYIVMGTTQLRSVPYALYAETSGSSTPGPQGAQGIQGIQGLPGDTGAVGPQGPMGLTGATGPAGNDGADGNDGAVGATGPPGVDGVDGQDGAVGPQGPIGLTGATGPAGNDGSDGNDGAVGATGPPGVDGVDGQDGAVGPQGPIGLTGATGPAGNDGSDGNDGPVGATGPQGNDGADGNDGAVGATGPPGNDGYTPMFGVDYFNGQDGVDGTNGTNGVDGVDGIDGIDAVVDYDSLANIISVDSSFAASVSSGISGGGCDYVFPEGIGESIAWDLSNSNDYTVPVGKNLFITNVHSSDGSSFKINGIRVIDELYGIRNASNNDEVGMLRLPLCASSGDVISASTNSTYTETFYGILTDAIVDPISFAFNNDSYTVPIGQKLIITNLWMYGTSNNNLTIDGVIIAAESFNKPSSNGNKYLHIPLIVNSGSVISIPTSFASFNGYLVDENYFAGCGGGGTSNSGTGNMVVSTFGDSLTINGQSIIVPGISFSNVVPTFGSVTDTSGNIYTTVVYGNLEIMTENLRTDRFNNGDLIIEECFCGTNVNSMCSDPYWTYYTCSNTQYGKLYNGTVILDNRNVCPTNWHIVSAGEWQAIFDLFSPPGSTNTNALLLSGTNESYLSLLLGGSAGPGGANYHYGAGTSVGYWQSNLQRTDITLNQGTVNNGTGAYYDYRYVRCVKD